MNTISVFLPTRKGSERIPNKNTKDFNGIKGGLLRIKLAQLVNVSEVGEIILSTDDPWSMAIAEDFNDPKIKIVPRPARLAQSVTNLKDLIRYVPTICTGDHILWTHVTSPFTDELRYSESIKTYLKNISENSGVYDSLMSGRIINSFLWDSRCNNIFNTSSQVKWPRTQDLTKLFEIDSAIFLASREIYLREDDRIGKNPYLFEQDLISSVDIDWEEDFILAEQLYKFQCLK